MYGLAFPDHINYISEKQFPEAGSALNELQQALEKFQQKIMD